MELKPAAHHGTRDHVPSTERSDKQLCRCCSSRNRSEFNAEVAIHFTGLKGLDKPIVWVFPKLLVCLTCGAAIFDVPRNELSVLAGKSSVEGALTWPEAA